MPRKPGAFTQLFTKQKWTLLSLLIVLAMYAMVTFTNQADQLARQQNLAQTVGQGLALKIGGPFQLTDQNGHPFTEKNLLGHYNLIYFGYTFCPDVCPTSLINITDAYTQLTPAQQKQLQVIFISVDPSRDTQPVLAEYMQAFNPDYIGLTGSKKAVDEAAKAYQAYYALQNNGEGEDYFVDHSAWIYLMSPQGTYLNHYPHTVDPARLLTDLQSLLGK